MLNPHGKEESWGGEDMITHVVSLDIEKIHPEIAAMAKEILDIYSLEDVNRQCAEVGAFYNWTKDVLKKLEENGKIAQISIEPSDPSKRLTFRIERQKFLLNTNGFLKSKKG